MKATQNEYNLALDTTEIKLKTLQSEQLKAVKNNRLISIFVVTLSFCSLGWQVAQYFALV